MKRILLILLLFPLFVFAQPGITISTHDTAVCRHSAAHFTATVTGAAAPHFYWEVNGTHSGGDSAGFITTTLVSGDTVRCLLTNVAGDTVLARSNDLRIRVDTAVPGAGVIVAPYYFCTGDTVIATESVSGGVWFIEQNWFGYASIIGDKLTGVCSNINNRPDIYALRYTVSNSCGSASVSRPFEIDPYPLPTFGIPSAICVGSSESIVYTDRETEVTYYTQLYSVTGDVRASYSSIYGDTVGNDYVYYIVSNTCATDTFGNTVTVIGLPIVAPISATITHVCVGDTIILSDSTPYGSWGRTNQNAIVFEGNVIGIKPGIDTIVYGVTQCGITSVSIEIRVDPPLPIIGPNSFCQTTSISLLDPFPGGTWSLNKPQIATIDQYGALYGISQGTAVISYAFGTCVASKTITVNPVPVIKGPTSVCLGDVVSLYDSFTGTWKSSDVAIASIDNNGNIWGMTVGTDTIFRESALGCNAATLLVVKPLPPPIMGDTNICWGRTGLLYDPDGKGKWTSSDPSTVTVDDTSGRVYGINEGRATITFTSARTGCPSIAPVRSFLCNEKSMYMSIFPNPAHDELTLYAYTDIIHTYTIMNTFGRVIQKKLVDASFTNADITFLPCGLYFVVLNGSDGRDFIFKLAKE
jgi:hypothetical protein